MSAPEIRIDEDGTTWLLVGEHNGKAYYAKPEIFDPPKITKVTIDPGTNPTSLHTWHPIITNPTSTIKITGTAT